MHRFLRLCVLLALLAVALYGAITDRGAYTVFTSTKLAVMAGGRLWRHWNAVNDTYWRHISHGRECYFDEFASKPWTPRELMGYCRMTFEFENDPMGGLVDNMQPPWAFLLRKRGDCEDWSNFMMHVLQQQGKQAWLFFVFSPSGGHCVCFFREGSTWSHISNRGLSRGLETWDALLTDVSRDWIMAYMVGPDQVLIPIWRDR